MNPETRDEAQARLKRVAGQVAGIQRMVDQDRYCVDVMLQVAAVQAALIEVGKVILGGHVETCLTDALKSRDQRERRKKIDELLDVFSRFCRIEEPTAAVSARRKVNAAEPGGKRR